jgi:FkbM family methyltransferase
MKKVFLDVGGHTGETLREVIDARYGFDTIYCFEPAASCWPAIEAIGDRRIVLCKFGLWNKAATQELFGAGGLGASIFADAEPVKGAAEKETIELVRATDWIKEHLDPTDVVFMKLNCEGAECDVVEDLLDSGTLAQLYNVQIDFDIRNVPSLRWREQRVRRRLRETGHTNVCFSDDVMIGSTHEARIGHWLHLVGGDQQGDVETLRRRYAETLRRLSSKRGYWAQLEGLLRRAVFRRLPPSLKSTARRVWRASPWADRRVPGRG